MKTQTDYKDIPYECIMNSILTTAKNMGLEERVFADTIVMPNPIFYKTISSPSFLKHGYYGAFGKEKLYGLNIQRSYGDKLQVISNTGRGVIYDVHVDFWGWKRELLKHNLVIHVKTRCNALPLFHKNEWAAIETLRDMITEAEFRKYIKCGFILVKGKCGQIYQIYRNRHHVKVWDKGKVTKEVCVYITDKTIPLTDKVIAFKTIIETSEEEFLKMGNVYKTKA